MKSRTRKTNLYTYVADCDHLVTDMWALPLVSPPISDHVMGQFTSEEPLLYVAHYRKHAYKYKCWLVIGIGAGSEPGTKLSAMTPSSVPISEHVQMGLGT